MKEVTEDLFHHPYDDMTPEEADEVMLRHLDENRTEVRIRIPNQNLADIRRLAKESDLSDEWMLVAAIQRGISVIEAGHEERRKVKTKAAANPT